MFLILQAFKPPVFSPPVLQSSSTRSSNVLLRILQYPSIRGIEISRSYRATPLAKIRHKHPSTGSYLPFWGWIFSDPSRILCAGGPFSATPIAFCASECQKHMGKCSVAIFTPSCPSCWPSCPSCWPSWRQHVPQVLSRCPKNAILEPTSPKKCFSHLFKHPKIPKKQ